MEFAKLAAGLILTSLWATAAAALPQQTSPVEVGAAATVLNGNRFDTTTDAGLVGRFTYNFSPSFSIDSEVGGYFTNASVRSSQYGGRPLLALVGPKAGFRTRHVDFFLKMRGGILSYPSVFAAVPSLNPPLVRKTDFVLDVGAVAEFRTSARTFIRVDIGKLLVRDGDALISQSTSGQLQLIARTTGFVGAPLHIEVGAGFRLGAVRQQTERSPAASRFTAGAQYSLLTLVRSFNVVRDESSIGGFFTWDFSKYVGLDSSVLFFPRKMEVADFQQGGRTLQAVGGLRAGVRRGRIGVFAKVRPGIQLFTLTEQSVSATPTEPANLTTSPFADVALDVGGILEFYATRRMVLRLDAGQTVVIYRARTIPTFGQNASVPEFSANALQVSLGLGFRFGGHGADTAKH
jgi:hypothetical protein